ncbi:hypothetical protein [Xenorhabdus bovienii]|uniref:hypothetical protein n=1 Tax=Xenorhabdus bovienii TaxID=40576 RepID=UPI00237C6132|nr:hypothetical protein [Xenorhabdus bovienii]MDE1482707.1 hypothetical protein [Xenorhabdus bovienii]
MAVYLEIFEAYFVAGSSKITDKLYANGNHQVKVVINIRKHVDDSDVPLTPEEKESVTITARSTNVDAPIYSGWSCDKTKNEYDEGLRGEKGSQYAEENLIYLNNQQKQQKGVQEDAESEAIYRYLRSAATPNESMEFMVVITIDGQKLTTNMESYIQTLIVVPRSPYKIKSNELSLKLDHVYHKQYTKDQSIDVEIYYWTLPLSLRIKDLQIKGGMQVPEGVAVTPDRRPIRRCLVLNMSTIKLTVYGAIGLISAPFGDENIPLLYGDVYIRGTKGSWENYGYAPVIDDYPVGCIVTIIDNFGCTSQFEIKPTDDVNILQIYDG